MLPIMPRCAGLLLIVCAAVQGDAVNESARAQAAKHDAMVMMQDIVLVFGSSSGLDGDCRNGTNCGDSQVCSEDDGACACIPGYQWALVQPHNQQVCSQCPGLHHSCGINDCCYPDNETRCYKGICQCRYESVECSMESVDQFKLATQIALVSAIILVIACLLILLWRTCRKQQGQRRRRRVQRRSDASEASLTSVQLRVIERLRNRPPGYHDRTHIRIEKPPSYEETIGQPLRYPALLLDPAYIVSEVPVVLPAEDQAVASHGHVETDDAGAASGGVDNSAFVDDERDSKQTPPPELHM